MRLMFLVFWCCLSWAAHANDPELLEPQKAFRYSAQLVDIDRIEVRYQIAKGYYLYRDKFAFAADVPGIALGVPALPPGEFKHDKFFGDSQIYRGDLRFVLPFKVGAAPVPAFQLNSTSQGCADFGVCYPPQDQLVRINLAAPSSSAPAANGSAFLRPVVVATPSGNPDTPVSGSSDTLIAALFSGGFWPLIMAFMGFGLLLAFTPCVFPMIPILSSMLVPHGERLTRGRGLLLSVFFVLGMALTYAAAGVAAGLLGTLLSSALQNPWVLSAFAAIFVLLALAMFGLYELQLPSALQTRLAAASNQLHGGHLAGVFGMGSVSALIVGPCVAPPLAGALLYIGQSGDVVLGGTALFAMALGMGVPLLVIGASAGSLLPRVGPWMETVKRLFGAVLLGTAIYLLSPVLPATVYLLAWAALLIVAAVYLHAIDPLPPGAPGYRKLFKGLGVIALAAGIALMIGALAGSRDLLQPLGVLRGSAASSAARPAFQRVQNLAQVESIINASAGRPVMLDFYADWCVTCKEMEHETFVDGAVQQRMASMVKLQADVTANLADDQALLKHFGLYGPPGTIFFDRHGSELRALRVIGFEPADRFAGILDRVLAATP